MIVSSLVSHFEGSLVLKEEGDATLLEVPAGTVEVPGGHLTAETVVTAGRIGKAELFASFLLATEASYGSGLGGSNANCVIGPEELLSTINIVECQWQVRDSGWLLGLAVYEFVQKHELAFLH